MTIDGPVVFVHAHPDDEAIFTGGSLVRLAAAGVDTVLVVATGGELGEVRPGFAPEAAPPGSEAALPGAGPAPAASGSTPTSTSTSTSTSDPIPATSTSAPGDSADPSAAAADLGDLGALRRRECLDAAAVLGVGRTEFLSYRDSGMAGDPANHAPGSFWTAPVTEAADRLAGLLASVGASAVVGYDDTGIYGHPDHIQVTRVTRAAARLAGVATVYGATVDREYLHFVETHLVEEAVLAGDLGLVRSRIGVPSVEVATTVAVHDVLDHKRRAMAAHASQIPESASALRLPDDRFADVYGLEWYVREGPPGPLDRLG